jgi:hypothetical protein
MHRILNQDLLIDNILVTEQYGFRNVISTEYATFRLTDSISKSITKKKNACWRKKWYGYARFE